jgi:hypothetical protein
MVNNVLEPYFEIGDTDFSDGWISITLTKKKNENYL